MRRLQTNESAVFLTALLAGLLLAYFELVEFGLWGQVEYLWASETTIAQIDERNPHRYRYIVALPGFYLGEWLGRPFGEAAYIALFFAANCALWFRITGYVNKGRATTGIGFLVFVVLLLQMNGRGMFAWTAWLLTIHLCIQFLSKHFDKYQIAWALLALLLASVSTGVFVVVFATLAACLGWSAISARNWRLMGWCLGAIALVAGLFFDFFVLAIQRNIDFYGGVMPMLQHGLGKYLDSYYVLAMFAFFALVLTVQLFLLRGPISKIGFLSYPPLAGGLFGITVLTLAAPPLLIAMQSILDTLVRQAVRGCRRAY
jgi:hypothetical protein